MPNRPPTTNQESTPRSRTELVEIQFRGYKALRQFDVNLKQMNILVGGNNNGKSTIIGALRILSAGLRRANAVSPVGLIDDVRHTVGWAISENSIPVSLENVHTDYDKTNTTILFKFANGNSLKLLFPPDGGCKLIPIVSGRIIRTPTNFREAFPFKLAVVPVLGPLEPHEILVNKETVQKNQDTHRAAGNFRNYWYYYPDGFAQFADLVQTTWPDMVVDKPYIDNINELIMFVKEGIMPRELSWCGFGFQVWCQLLTHVSRNNDADLLVIDEPEIYLHPDVQRQLLSVLRDTEPAILLATHSTEIMAEAEPSDLVLIDKERDSGRRLTNTRAVQTAFLQIGSVHNPSLVQAVRTRRVLFMEDTEDFMLLKQFAKLLGLHRIVKAASFAVISSGGYGSWKEIKGIRKRIQQVTSDIYNVAAIYDRDYRCKEELESIGESLRENLDVSWILECKEIENYLLNPSVIDRIVASQLIDIGQQTVAESDIGTAQILDEISERHRHEVFAQYSSHRNSYLRQHERGVDESVFTQRTLSWFEEQWSTQERRLRIVPGKSTLRELRGIIEDRYKVMLNISQIAESFKQEEVPVEIKDLLNKLDTFSRL